MRLFEPRASARGFSIEVIEVLVVIVVLEVLVMLGEYPRDSLADSLIPGV